jgi:hypothetical protein
VPEKFWDAERGELRVDALLKSYRELERRMSQRAARPAPDADEEERRRWREMMNIPDSPDGYEVQPKHDLCGPDSEINQRLHEAGFSCEQVQLVYDLAAERLLPLVAEAAQQFEADRQAEKLRAHFGGEERFRRVAAQLKAWGTANLPPGVLEALSTTEEGALALERMMRGDDANLPWKGMQAKQWLGATWIPHTGLTKTGTIRSCYFFHKTAIGHAAAAEITTDVTWHGDRAAHFVNSMMSQGACLIDDAGVVRMCCKE